MAMDEEAYGEYWDTMYGDIYLACPCLLSNKQLDFGDLGRASCL